MPQGKPRRTVVAMMRIECNLIVTFKSNSTILRLIKKDIDKYISSLKYFITIRNIIAKYLYKPK